MKSAYGIVQIIRPVNALITFISGMAACYIAVPFSESVLSTALLVGLSAVLTGAGGNIINDYFDIAIDAVNRPLRPIPSGVISPRFALVLYGCAVCAALLCALPLGVESLGIVVFSNIIIFLYSFRLKRIPLLGNIVVSFFTGLVFIYGAEAAGSPEAGVLPFCFAFLTNFIREIVKDIEDIEGDTKAGVFTFPQRFGFMVTRRVISGLLFLLLLFILFPFIFKWYKIEFFVVCGIFIFPMLAYFAKLLFSGSPLPALRRMSLTLKGIMIIGLAAIYLGS